MFLLTLSGWAIDINISTVEISLASAFKYVTDTVGLLSPVCK